MENKYAMQSHWGTLEINVKENLESSHDKIIMTAHQSSY